MKKPTRTRRCTSGVARTKPLDGRQTSVVPLLTVEARLKRALRTHLHQLGFRRIEGGRLAPRTIPRMPSGSFTELNVATASKRSGASS